MKTMRTSIVRLALPLLLAVVTAVGLTACDDVSTRTSQSDLPAKGPAAKAVPAGKRHRPSDPVVINYADAVLDQNRRLKAMRDGLYAAAQVLPKQKSVEATQHEKE